MKKLIIASKNPVKVQATLNGFQEMFPQEAFEAKGVSVLSGVSDQPMGDEETYQGALNRALAAQKAQEADYWIGIEGGNIPNDYGMETMAWIIIIDKEGRKGHARTAGFYLPPKVIELVNQGYELGHADDIVFGTENSKQTTGSAGLLTEGVMDRIRFYTPAVILALIPFKQKKLYPMKSL